MHRRSFGNLPHQYSSLLVASAALVAFLILASSSSADCLSHAEYDTSFLWTNDKPKVLAIERSATARAEMVESVALVYPSQ